METGLRAYLLSQTTVTNVIGQRMFPVKMPAAQSYPAIVFMRRSTERDYHQGGALGGPRATTVLHCLADDYTEASALANAVRLLVDGAHNTTWDTTAIKLCVVADESDQFFQPIEGSDVGYYSRVLVLSVTYIEELPAI